MEKRLFRIILSAALIALLILLECSESSLKEQRSEERRVGKECRL